MADPQLAVVLRLLEARSHARRGREPRCRFVAPRRVSLTLSVRPAQPVYGAPPALRAVGEDGEAGEELRVFVDGRQLAPRIVRVGSTLYTAGGAWTGRTEAAADVLAQALGCGPGLAWRYAARGWVPGQVGRPAFLALCYEQAYRPESGWCSACVRLGGTRGRALRWRR